MKFEKDTSGELPVVPDKKRHAHSKNAAKEAKEIREHLYRINGVDLSLVDGFGVSLAQTVTMEVGSNVGEKFPTEKHFCAWPVCSRRRMVFAAGAWLST